MTASTRQTKLEIEYWDVGRLIPYARNARTHDERQVIEIAGSIRAFGFTNPILVSPEGDVIAGHGRLAAARRLAMPQVPVIVLAGLSEIERRQLVLADNRIALNSGWDTDMLHLELADLSALGVDLGALGFSDKELAAAFNANQDPGLVDEDDVPGATEETVSRPGDVWLLGEHRIICGDSTDPHIVARVLAGAAPNLMVTDPPYGVEYDPSWRNRMGVSTSKRQGKVLNDERADWADAWALFPGDIAYIWHGALHAATVADSLTRTGFNIRAQIIWAKPRLVIGRGDYHWQHEPCWYAVRKKGHWTGDRKQTTLWTIDAKGQDAETIHGTQKPVECMRRPIANNTVPGEVVYEPFLGSGTTLIAAHSIGRICIGIELNPVYVDVVVRRWQAFSGESATLEAEGRKTFTETADLRAARSSSETPSEVLAGEEA